MCRDPEDLELWRALSLLLDYLHPHPHPDNAQCTDPIYCHSNLAQAIADMISIISL